MVYKHPKGPQTFQMVWKLSRWSGNFPDGLETFQCVVNFQDVLKIFQKQRITQFLKNAMQKIFGFLIWHQYTIFMYADC